MILVLLETDPAAGNEQLLDVSREALSEARRVAAVGDLGEVHAVLVGPAPASLAEEAGRYGASVVHHADGDAFTDYAAAAHANALVTAARATGASAVTAAGTPRGNEVLAHAAVRLDVAMAANVVKVESTDPWVVSRQVVGGSAFEQMRLPTGIAVLSVAGHAVDESPVDGAGAASLEPLAVDVDPKDLRARVTRVEAKETADTSGLTSAKVVVGAGRGAGSPEGFGELLELTELLGGTLGVTRVVTSLGWRPHHEQVGQTGSRISPDLYVACGISGAIQHWAGCSSAKTILAVNTDAEAPMMTRAHYAVVGDLHEVIPAVNEEIRRRKG